MAAASIEDDDAWEEVGEPEMEELERGDLVVFPRFRGLYEHYGVAVDKKHVVHLASADPGPYGSNFSCNGPQAEVKKERISDVAWGGGYLVLSKHEQDEDCRDSLVIVRDAEDMVGRITSYNLWNKNCEHFARKLVFGVSRCTQVHNDEINRNRSRVMEINQYIDHLRGELENWDVLEQ